MVRRRAWLAMLLIGAPVLVLASNPDVAGELRIPVLAVALSVLVAGATLGAVTTGPPRPRSARCWSG